MILSLSQMLEWFKRYRNLLYEKSEIRNVLRQERQNLLVLLQDYIHDLSTAGGNSGDSSKRLDLPEIIVEVIQVKETHNKVWTLKICLRAWNSGCSLSFFYSQIKEIENNILPLLDDLMDYDKVKDSVLYLRKELQSTDTGLFNKWSTAMIRALSNSELRLDFLFLLGKQFSPSSHTSEVSFTA